MTVLQALEEALCKNLVLMMWQGSNIEVIDRGNDVPPEEIAADASRAVDLAHGLLSA